MCGCAASPEAVDNPVGCLQVFSSPSSNPHTPLPSICFRTVRWLSPNTLIICHCETCVAGRSNLPRPITTRPCHQSVFVGCVGKEPTHHFFYCTGSHSSTLSNHTVYPSSPAKSNAYTKNAPSPGVSTGCCTTTSSTHAPLMKNVIVSG